MFAYLRFERPVEITHESLGQFIPKCAALSQGGVLWDRSFPQAGGDSIRTAQSRAVSYLDHDFDFRIIALRLFRREYSLDTAELFQVGFDNAGIVDGDDGTTAGTRCPESIHEPTLHRDMRRHRHFVLDMWPFERWLEQMDDIDFANI